MLTFYFVRHGVKENFPFDPPLTKLGVKQAELTAKYLQNIPFKAIVASHKLRTQQTAHIIAKQHGLPVQVDERLQERLEWENDQPFDEFCEEWTKTDIDRKYQPKRGESSVNKGRQVNEAIDELSKMHKNGNIIIVTHGGTMADFLRHLFGQEKLPHKINPVTGARYMGILECSITVVEKVKDNYKLIKINDKAHLSTLG